MAVAARLTLLLAAAALSACASVQEAPRTSSPASSPQPRGEARTAFRVRDVMGKTGAELDRQFGAPALVRREGEGEFRRYTLKACSLIVILYPDDQGNATAGFVDSAAKTAAESKPDLGGCLAGG